MYNNECMKSIKVNIDDKINTIVIGLNLSLNVIFCWEVKGQFEGGDGMTSTTVTEKVRLTGYFSLPVASFVLARYCQYSVGWWQLGELEFSDDVEWKPKLG